MNRPVHLDVLRRWRLEGKGLRAGVGALFASLAAFALGVPSAWHLGAIVIGAAVAAAWPLRSDERSALRWVGERVGLAYETAWQLSHAQPMADARASALHAAVEVQGRLSVRDLRPPAAAAWWLPLATVAFGLWLWAAWVGGGGAAMPTGPVPGPPPTTTSPVAAPDDAFVEDASIDDPAALDAPEDATRARNDDGSGEATSAGSGSPTEGGAPAERDVLDRFLDRLRERPPEDEEAARARRAAAAGVEDEDEEDGDPAAPDGDAMRSGEALEERDPESDRRPGGEGDGEGRTEDESEGDPGDAGDLEGDGPEAAGDPGSGPDDQAGGGDPLGVDEGSDEGSAGIGVSAPGDAGPAADPAAGDPEPLPSLLGPGEELPIGGVQLPGVGPDGGFPSGPAGTAFRRGVEEALNEGDLPVAYQEVIRNYFR